MVFILLPILSALAVLLPQALLLPCCHAISTRFYTPRSGPGSTHEKREVRLSQTGLIPLIWLSPVAPISLQMTQLSYALWLKKKIYVSVKHVVFMIPLLMVLSWLHLSGTSAYGVR